MIYPIQKVLPLEFPDESRSTIKESKPEFGPLNLRLCQGIVFSSRYQLPIIKPVEIDIPDNLLAFYRKPKQSDMGTKIAAHFYTPDRNIECVWNNPYFYIEKLRKFHAVISTDYSILSNMLEIQRHWNDFRNKLLTAYYQRWNVTMISSPSWSDDIHNIDRYMEGWPHHSMIAINSTGVCRDKRARHIWLDGYFAMLDILQPLHILRYGGYIEGERRDISTYYTNNNKQF